MPKDFRQLFSFFQNLQKEYFYQYFFMVEYMYEECIIRQIHMLIPVPILYVPLPNKEPDVQLVLFCHIIFVNSLDVKNAISFV